jgi:hypothetical protein
MVVMEKFYQELGHLFYAVASVDKKIAKEEISELKKCISEQWLHFEDTTDEFGMDAAFQIEAVFEWLEDRDEKADFAFHEFEEYFNGHKKIFNDKVKSMIFNTCEKIASSYGTKNKAELELLGKISVLFK